MEILAFVGALLTLGVLAIEFGADTTRVDDERWRQI